MAATDDGAPARDALERIAFARAETPEEIAAAQDALKQLVALDAAADVPDAASIPDSEAEIDPVTEMHESAPAIDEEDEDRPVRRPRSLIPLLLVIGLFVGAVAGVLIAHLQDSPSTTIGSAPTATPTPHRGDASAALQSLLVLQTTPDLKFPLKSYAATLNIQPTSVHRIMNISDGATLWAARTDTDICLLWSEPSTGTDQLGGASCATPAAFDISGLTLSEGSVTWSWDGTTFTTTTRAAQG